MVVGPCSGLGQTDTGEATVNPDLDVVRARDRLEEAQIALDVALTNRLANEPWRISAALGGPSVWPPDCGRTVSDLLLEATLEHRFRLRLHGFERHPRVHGMGLCVDALLRLMSRD